MKLPKYRFLLGSLTPTFSGYSYGFYDEVTGQYVQESPSTSLTRVASIQFLGGLHGDTYIASDGNFVKDLSYITLYAGNDFIGAVRMIDIIGNPYLLPNSVTWVGITLDRTEMLTDNPRPLYVLNESKPVYSKLSKKIAKESGQKFFREQLDTDLHFVGKEADYFSLFDADGEFMLVCQRQVDEYPYWATYHADRFGFTDCKFDLNAHVCTPTLSTLDVYSRILERYSDEYDLIKLKPAISRLTTYLRPIIELYERGSSVITRFLGGTYWETEINSPIDDEHVLIDDEHFERITIDEQWGYIDVKFIDPYDSYWPSGRYQYDPTNNYYFLQSGGFLWAFVPDIDPISGACLAFTKDGQPVLMNNYPVLMLPDGYSGATDLPLDLDDPQAVFFWYIDPVSGALAPVAVGGAFCRLYDIFGRVIGNGGTLFGQSTFDIPQDDFAVDSPAYKKCAPLAGAQAVQGYVYLSLDTSTEPTIYGIKSDPDEYYTNENLPVEGGIDGVKPMPIGKYEWGEGSFWYNYGDNYVALEEESRWRYQFKDCFKLEAAIRALLAKIDPSITFAATPDYSVFLYGSDEELTRKGYEWKLAITPKSNVLKGDYDQPARKAPITFESLMGMLRDLYHLYWFIDDNRRLRIEHATWFVNGGSYEPYSGGTQIDLSAFGVTDLYNKKRTGYWQGVFDFNTAEAVRRIELDFAEDGTEFFSGLSVDILNSYVKEAGVDSKSVSNFTADIDLMRIEPSRYSQDGFAVLAYVDYEIIKEVPVYNPNVPIIGAVKVTDENEESRNAYINNLFASWLYCQHFLMGDLSGDEIKQSLQMSGLPNGDELDEVYGLALLKKQKIQYPFENDPDTVEHITTYVGEGVPEDFEVDALTRTVKATISFPVKNMS